MPSAIEVANLVFYGCTALTSVYFGQNAPAEATDVYTDSPNVTNYVTNPQATGWGATWNGRPVVRLHGYFDGVTVGGTNLTTLLAGKLNTNATPGSIGAEVAGAAATVQTNLTTHTNRTDNPHAVTPEQIGAVSNTPAGIAAAGGVITNSILGQGETDLGTGLTVTICNATASYYAAPTGTWTLAMCASPLRYPRDLMIVSTNGSVIPSYITDLRTGSVGTTNLYYLRPSGTGTNWTLWGKSL
jgi:hypothetical protein